MAVTQHAEGNSVLDGGGSVPSTDVEATVLKTARIVRTHDTNTHHRSETYRVAERTRWSKSKERARRDFPDGESAHETDVV